MRMSKVLGKNDQSKLASVPPPSGVEQEVELEVRGLPAAAYAQPPRRIESGHHVVDLDLAPTPANLLVDARAHLERAFRHLAKLDQRRSPGGVCASDRTTTAQTSSGGRSMWMCSLIFMVALGAAPSAIPDP